MQDALMVMLISFFLVATLGWISFATSWVQARREVRRAKLNTEDSMRPVR